MSSEGSISSRFSQFGLYRTIDARTEEFLKLSKKRQIKQGCVCAAISTAVTVTVVVTVILVYEYNAVAEAKRTSSKLHWLEFMNKSINDVVLHERFNKANINIDKNTLKLLPIVLKALNQHRYIDKIKEETTTRYPPLVATATTDIDYAKNIFADTRNWMKMPTSRLYAIEYKTSPIVYFKNPTRNVDYFTKIRKIRDYQRILNYVDNMISDRNSLGSTLPLSDRTEKPVKLPTIMKNNKIPPKNITQKISASEILKKEKKIDCKCPHKIGELVNKLLISIQKLLSYFSGYNLKETAHQCRPPLESKQQKSSIDKLTPTSEKIIENQQNLQFEITTESFYNKFLNKHKYKVDFTNTFDIQKGHTFNAINNIIKPSYGKQIYFSAKNPSNENYGYYTTTNGYVVPFETNIRLKETSTESFSKYIFNNKIPANVVTTVADYILQKGTDDESSETKSSVSFADLDFTENKDNTETTSNLAIYFNKLDAHSLELFKTKLNPEKNYNSQEKSLTYPFKGARRNQTIYTNIGQMRKFGKLVTNNINKTTESRLLHRFAPNSAKDKSTTHRNKSLIPTIKPTDNNLAICNKSKSHTRNETFIVNNINNLQQNSNNTPTEEETAKALEDNLSKEALRTMEDAIEILNNETTNYIDNLTTILDDSNEWKTVKLKENITLLKSMIPNSKSTYLEIQRNDWMHDENRDYDNYSFD